VLTIFVLAGDISKARRQERIVGPSQGLHESTSDVLRQGDWNAGRLQKTWSLSRLPSNNRTFLQQIATSQQRKKANVALPSQRYGISTDRAANGFRLTPLDPRSIITHDRTQIGIVRPAFTRSNKVGQLFLNNDGTKVRVITVTSPAASAVRVRFSNFALPVGDELHVYGLSPDSHVSGPYTGNGPFNNGTFWAGTIEGDTLVIEHYIKGREKSFEISEVAHIYNSVESEVVSPNSVASCEVDASCFEVSENNSVGRITFVRPGTSTLHLCTGTLLDNTNHDSIPYFLTAAHCISSEAEANTAEIYWFYQTDSCNSNKLRSDIFHSDGGATLLATLFRSDSALLRIQGVIPNGLFFSRWDNSPVSLSTRVFGLHHPGNGRPGTFTSALESYLRRSEGRISDLNTLGCLTGSQSTYLNVNWTSGLTEDGSSGSGLWYTQNGLNYLIGNLSCGGGEANCDFNNSRYGKFSDFYAFVEKFLNPPDPAGHLDVVDCRHISGWALDRHRLDLPVTLDIYDIHDSVIDVYSVVADDLRPDVGSHGFNLSFPRSLSIASHRITVKIRGTNFQLENSPQSFQCSADTVAPTVIINSPSGNPFVTSNSSVNVNGNASDTVGVTQVSWSNNRGGSGVATGTTSWSVNGIHLQAGTNIITISARDAAGNIGSATLTVTQSTSTSDTSPPIVKLSTPTTGSTYTTSGNSLTVTGNATDNIGVTQVTCSNDRGGSCATSGTTNWTANATSLQSGTNVLTIRARDAAGNSGVATLTITYTPPPVCDGGTSENYRVNGGPPLHPNGTLVKVRTDPTVYLIQNGQKRGIPSQNILNNLYQQPNGGFQNKDIITIAADELNRYPTGAVINSSLPSNGRSQPDGRLIQRVGSSEISVISGGSRLPFANEGTFLGLGYLYCNVIPASDYDSYPVGIIVDAITTLRFSSITPSSLQTKDWNQSVTYTFTVVDGNGSAISGAAVGGQDNLRNIGAFLATSSTDANGRGTYTTTVPTGKEKGIYDILFQADKTGYTRSNLTVRQVEVNHFQDSTAPAIQFISPTTNSTYNTNNTSLTISGAASDDVGVQQVTWSNDRGGSGVAAGTTSWTVNGVILKSGTNVLTVIAEDEAGNIGLDRLVVNFTPPPTDTTAPTVSITSPTPGPTFDTDNSSLTMAGTSTDNLGVTEVIWTNDRGGSGTASGTSNWTVTSIPLQPGINLLTVIGRDAAGNVGTTNLTVNFTSSGTDTTGPVLSVTSPSDGQVVTTNSITVSGDASDLGTGASGISSVTINGTRANNDTAAGSGTAAWSLLIPLTPGSNTVTVVARDASPNQNATTRTISVTLSIPTTITVTNTNDSGPGSFRQALMESNSTAGTQTIGFNIPGAGVHTIVPVTQLPATTDSVIIDGYSQPGSRKNTSLNGNNAILFIQISGTAINSSANPSGLIIGGGNSIIRGLVINGFTSGIAIGSLGANVIEGNFIGTNTAGDASFGNRSAGITIGDSSNNKIGGSDPGSSNLISGNFHGIFAFAPNGVGSANVVQGNFIGTDASGMASLGNTAVGILLVGLNSTVIGGNGGERNLIAGNGTGIDVQNSTGNQIRRNLLGTDILGTAAIPNGGAIQFFNVKTTDVADNLISGNQTAIFLSGKSSGNHIKDNLIGTDITGRLAIANEFGVFLQDASDNMIGGLTVSERNVISGNNFGISITQPSSGNRIQNNFIGTAIDGTSALGNQAIGVILWLDSSNAAQSNNNTIGATSIGSAGGNIIAHNGKGMLGFPLRGGVHIGSGVGNSVLSNLIFDNDLSGINLGEPGVTPNDTGDADTGPNNLQNFPIVNSAVRSNNNTVVQGVLNSVPASSYSLQFFSSNGCHSSGHGDAENLVGHTTLMTDDAGNAAFTVPLSSSVSIGQVISATATDSTGNTSEFSTCVTVASPPCNYSISPSTFNSPAGGGSSTVTIMTAEGCPWSAVSNQSWLTITTADNGSGTGAVSYFATPNIGSLPRTGTLTVAGQTVTVVQPALPSGVPILVSEAASMRAIALDAASFVREPFSLDSPIQFGGLDHRTRIMLFTMNFELLPTENISVVTADAEDGAHRIYPLTVEYVGRVPGLDWLGCIVVRLHDDMQNLGDVLTRITVRGVPSNRVRVAIGHVGGGLPDDTGAVPTPGRQP
jgi:hypothetical protein